MDSGILTNLLRTSGPVPTATTPTPLLPFASCVRPLLLLVPSGNRDKRQWAEACCPLPTPHYLLPKP
jgi:hypothetical protein